MKRTFLFLALLIVVILGVYGIQYVKANAAAAEPTLPTDQKAFEAVRATLAQELKVDPLTIALVSAEAVEWSDSCLGLGGPAESCLQRSLLDSW